MSFKTKLVKSATDNNKVSYLYADNNNQVWLTLEPRSIEETWLASRAIKDRKTVIINLAYLAPQQVQRTVDFLAGCTCAVDGSSTWIGQQTYLFAASGVKVNK